MEVGVLGVLGVLGTQGTPVLTVVFALSEMRCSERSAILSPPMSAIFSSTSDCNVAAPDTVPVEYGCEYAYIAP
jgi:hypothetical protein